jgi:hypothetical protein
MMRDGAQLLAMLGLILIGLALWSALALLGILVYAITQEIGAWL